MTALQIQYRSLQEQQRSNMAREDIERERNRETHRSNITKEDQGQQSIDENKRHNKASETISVLGNVSKLGRHFTGAPVNGQVKGKSIQSGIVNWFNRAKEKIMQHNVI